MSKLRLVLLIALCAVWPATARAQSDFIDWLQQQSGPGPYHNYFKGYEIRIWCPPTGLGIMDTTARQVWNCFLDDAERTGGVLSFDATYAKTDVKRLFLDDPTDVREVREQRYTLAYVYRANRYLKVGGTLDFLRFASDQGNLFSFWRLGFGPRLTFAPTGGATTTNRRAASLNRLIQLQIDATYVPKGFVAADYNNAISRFDSGPEYQVRSSLVID